MYGLNLQQRPRLPYVLDTATKASLSLPGVKQNILKYHILVDPNFLHPCTGNQYGLLHWLDSREVLTLAVVEYNTVNGKLCNEGIRQHM